MMWNDTRGRKLEMRSRGQKGESGRIEMGKRKWGGNGGNWKMEEGCEKKVCEGIRIRKIALSLNL